ncbi:site-specific integrase [Cellulosilyticum sp. ST5]|uniref:site-specific integrase n=1 Tax=Cellulosilyticum sp. ST5 TaxID=3055805 RepID=UPI003977CD29
MNTVEPIRNFDLILDMQDYLYKRKNKRDYVLFMFGLYSGLRISDILPLKVRDVKNRAHIYFREEKTGKEKRIPINNDLKAALKEYIEDMQPWEYLFKSVRGNKNKPITRQRVWQMLNEVAGYFEYNDPIGCHTLRKTFGYWMYQDTKDAASIMDIFNHSDISVTKRYIGVTQDNNEKLMKDICFKKKRY